MYANTAPSIIELPCASSPYMLPRPRPEIRAERTSMCARESRAKQDGRPRRPSCGTGFYRLFLHSDRDDLVVDELRPDVVVLVDRVVVLGRERLGVLLDQPV